MSKTWVRQEVKRDELAHVTEKSLSWLVKNREAALAGGGAILLLAAFGGWFGYRFMETRRHAWDDLAIAESMMYANQTDRSLQQLGKVREEHPSASAAQVAGLLEGDVLYHAGKFKDAAEAYRRLAESGDPKFAPYGLAGQGRALDVSGQKTEAVTAYRRFLEQYPDHFLGAEIQTALAGDLLALGDKDQARKTYQGVASSFPDTPWASLAQERLKDLAPAGK